MGHQAESLIRRHINERINERLRPVSWSVCGPLTPPPPPPCPQVLDIRWIGDQLLGSIEILPTPSGMLLWELYSQVRQCVEGEGRGCRCWSCTPR